jgi:hypothetical protein
MDVTSGVTPTRYWIIEHSACRRRFETGSVERGTIREDLRPRVRGECGGTSRSRGSRWLFPGSMRRHSSITRRGRTATLVVSARRTAPCETVYHAAAGLPSVVAAWQVARTDELPSSQGSRVLG